TGLIPYNPTISSIKYKTKIKTKKIYIKSDFIPYSVPDPMVPAGNLFDENTALSRPVVIFRALNISNPDQYIDKVALLQLATFGFKPVFITNHSDFTCYRKYGYAFEYLPNKLLFSKSNRSLGYDEFVKQREVEI